jgi:hypothetical protein
MGINALRRDALGCRAPLLELYTTPIMPLEFPRKYNPGLLNKTGMTVPLVSSKAVAPHKESIFIATRVSTKDVGTQHSKETYYRAC